MKHTQRGNYTLRLDCHLILEKKLFNQAKTSLTINVDWKELWSVPAPPKFKKFVWRACKKIIPVKESLWKKSICQDEVCPCSGEE